MDGFWPTFARRDWWPVMPEGSAPQAPSTRMPPPSKVILPLQDDPGAPCEVYVSVGDRVSAGQKVGCCGKPPNHVGVHAPIAGVVEAFGLMPHPLARQCTALAIQEVVSDEPTPTDPYVARHISDLDGFLRDMGVLLDCPGQGAGLIVDVTEFEPVFSSAVRLVIEEREKIRDGLRLLVDAYGIRKTFLACERRHREVLSVLQDICSGIPNAAVLKVDRPYPHTLGELMRQRLARKNRQGHPLHPREHITVIAPAMIVAAYDAYYKSRPWITQMVSIAGSAFATPQNIWTAHGTPLADVIQHAGGLAECASRVTLGGPLMGQPQASLAAPIIKKTRGIYAAVALLIAPEQRSRVYRRQACIRCAKCIDVCPAAIAPNLIAELIEHARWGEAEDLGLFGCLECGLCHFVCPSMIPLAELLMLGKLKIGGPESVLRVSSLKTLHT